MKLSFQTVCIVFGVTLVHLLFIATLVPTGGGIPVRHPSPDSPVAGMPAVEEMEAPEEIVDLPARRREGVSTPAAADPVAGTRS